MEDQIKKYNFIGVRGTNEEYEVGQVLGTSYLWDYEFQSTHPCRVRLTASSNIGVITAFQSTHPCRVRHASDVNKWWRTYVSIHAPV